MDHPNKLPIMFPMPPSIPPFGFSDSEEVSLLPPKMFPNGLFIGLAVVVVVVVAYLVPKPKPKPSSLSCSAAYASHAAS